jgi:hypothetical protein
MNLNYLFLSLLLGFTFLNHHVVAQDDSMDPQASFESDSGAYDMGGYDGSGSYNGSDIESGMDSGVPNDPMME